MFVEETLRKAGYTNKEIQAMIHTKANTGLAWKSIIILVEQKKDNDIFAKIVNRKICNRAFKTTREVDEFIQSINTMELPDLDVLYNE